jgi:hypothetical protein
VKGFFPKSFSDRFPGGGKKKWLEETVEYK